MIRPASFQNKNRSNRTNEARGGFRRASIDDKTNRRLADLERFAHYAAHELKNPLQAIVVDANQLNADIDGLSSEEIRKRLDNITAEAKRLNEQVSTLLNSMSLEPHSYQPVTVELGPVIDAVLDSYSHELKLVEAQVTVSESAHNSLLLSDLRSLEVIVANLVSNSIRYRSPDRPLYIKIDASRVSQTEIEIQILDNGRGINPLYHSKIFAPLTRVDHDLPGNGLGLAVVQRLVTLLGGTVGVDSELDRGATFWIRLPISAAPEPKGD